MKSILKQNPKSKQQNSNNVILVVENNKNNAEKSDLNLSLQRQQQSSMKNASQSSLNGDNMSKQAGSMSEQKAQRLSHYENLNQFEHQHNSGSLALINSLQDNEFNDILTNVNDYINLSLNRVNKYDGLINVSWTDVNANQNTGWNKKSKKSTIPDMQQFDDKLSQSSSSTEISQNEPIITITSIIPMDLLQNGLRSGPFDTVKLTASELDQNKHHHGSTSSKSKIDTKTIIKLKYLIELELNMDYFDFTEVDEIGQVNAIRFKKKPRKWSIKDYDQVSIDLATSREQPFEKVVHQILTHREKDANMHRSATKIDYLKLSKPKSHRYLNSKALFDRLLTSFSSVLKYEWPYYHNPTHKENMLINEVEQPSALSTSNTVKTSTSNPANSGQTGNNNSVKYPISEECKKCLSNNNQLRISFNWRGAKHKDLEIIVLINIGIKYENDIDQIFVNRINESMLDILNNFLLNGGYFKSINKRLDLAQLCLIADWANKNLKLNLNSIYLRPSGVHHWRISLDCLKLNLVKFLVWANSLNQSFIGVDSVNDMLFNSSSSQKTGPKKFESKQPLYNYFSSLLLGKSTLQLLIRSIQIFTSLFSSSIDEKSKLDDDNLDFVDLFLENILLEMKLHSNPKITWSQEYLFDHLWSILIRFRYFILNSKLDDSFNIHQNFLPKIFHKYVEFEEFNKLRQHPLIMPFEQAMKTVFTSIILDEIYFPGQAKLFEMTIEKEKTIFNKSSNLIDDILDYKIKPERTNDAIKINKKTVSIALSAETGGKATLGSKSSKNSIGSQS